MKNPLIVLVCTAVLFFSQSHALFAVDIGDRAPDINGTDARNNNMLNLSAMFEDSSFKTDANGQFVIGTNGKFIFVTTPNVVILNFFASYCIPCMREIPTYNRIAESFAGKPVKMLYVNVDPDIDQSRMLRLIDQYKIDIPVMMPNQEEVMRQYDANKLPLLIVIDKNQKIAHKITGLDKTLEKRLTRIINTLLKQ